MTLLLDTHTFLWYALDDPNLSQTARQLILDAGHDKVVRSVTCWQSRSS